MALSGIVQKQDDLQSEVESTQKVLDTISQPSAPSSVVEETSITPSVTPQGPFETTKGSDEKPLSKAQRKKMQKKHR